MKETVIGIIELSKTVEINFYVDVFKDKAYANIRKFSKSERYTGPTKQGIKLSADKLSKILEYKPKLLSLVENPSEEEICRFKKSYSSDWVIKLVLYNGKYGLDIREIYKTEDGSDGFGKGLRIALQDIEKSIEFMEQMLFVLNPNNSKQELEKEPYKPAQSAKDTNKNDIPEDYEQYF